MEDAIHEMLTAQILDPVSITIACDTARVLFYGREFGAALEQCDRTIERAPFHYRVYWMLGLIQEQCGDIDEAVAALRRGIQLDPPNCILRGALSRLLALNGETIEAKQIVDEIKQSYIPAFEWAMIHFAFGDFDLGFQRLIQSQEERYAALISLNVDPRFDSLRNDPRLRAIVAEMRLL